MAFARELWAESFDPEFFPGFPCPACHTGRLQVLKDSLRFADHPTFCSTRLFQLFLKCTGIECEATVAVSGGPRYMESDQTDVSRNPGDHKV
jgi:hypothetical protein